MRTQRNKKEIEENQMVENNQLQQNVLKSNAEKSSISTNKKKKYNLVNYDKLFNESNLSKLTAKFDNAYKTNNKKALKVLFCLDDIKEDSLNSLKFRHIIKYLSNNYPDSFRRHLLMIPVVGSYADLLVLLDTRLQVDVLEMIKEQLQVDNRADVPSSLVYNLLKQDEQTNKKVQCYLKLLDYDYQQLIAKISNKYKVMIKNKTCSLTNSCVDELLDVKLLNKITKLAINMLVDQESHPKEDSLLNTRELSIPYELIAKYLPQILAINMGSSQDFTELEKKWYDLGDFVKSPTLVAIDTTNNMFNHVEKGKVHAKTIATAFAIYFSQRMNGAWKDKCLNYGNNSNIIDLATKSGVAQKAKYLIDYHEASTTNIVQVYRTTLDYALKHRIKIKDMPRTILVITSNTIEESRPFLLMHQINARMDYINSQYKKYNYIAPKLIHWQINEEENTGLELEPFTNVSSVQGNGLLILKLIMQLIEKNETLYINSLSSVRDNFYS